MGKHIDLIGKKFERLVVIEKTDQRKHHCVVWFCKCDCGNTLLVPTALLKNGNTRSCGCLQKDFCSTLNKKHGKCKERLHSTWCNMRDRCNNKNSPSYKYYGLRGIKVCKEWDDFMNFYNWAMLNGYSDNLDIDRINSNKDYCPENCQWLTRSQNSKKSRRSNFITYLGKTMNMSDWSKELGIPQQALRDRLNRLHWDIEKSMTEPHIPRNKISEITLNKIESLQKEIFELYSSGKSIHDISKILKLNRTKINQFLTKSGMREKGKRFNKNKNMKILTDLEDIDSLS